MLGHKRRLLKRNNLKSHHQQAHEKERPIWWSNYREEQSRPRVKMTKEMIVRKSIGTVVREYLNNTSLCGVNYLVDESKSKIEKCFWLVIILLAAIAVSKIVWNAWNDFVSKPIIVTLDSHHYPIENIPFPGVALCNINRISKKAAEEYTRKIYPIPNHTFEGVLEQIYNMGRLLDFEAEGFNQMLPFVEYMDSILDPDNLSTVERMKQLSPRCEDMLIRCAWQGLLYNCSELFTMRRTVNGFCCSFNYVRSGDVHGRAKLVDTVKRQVLAGTRYGLSLVVDPMLNDYAYPLHNSVGIDVLIFDGTDYPNRGSGRMVQRILQPNLAAYMMLESTTVESTPEVRKYSAETRKCRFPDELTSEYAGLYSYSSCLVACRLRAVQSLCKCVPFFMPYPMRKSPTCTMLDVPCLDKFREKLLYIYPHKRQGDEGLDIELDDSLDCPECLPDCEYTYHTTSTFNFARERSDGYKYPFSEGIDNENASFLFVFHETAETTLYRMDVVLYWFELLSNLGGVAGVWVGYSIISVMEVFYYITFRFYFILRENFRKYS